MKIETGENFTAEEFLRDARAAQESRGKLLRGEARTPPDTRLLISKAVHSTGPYSSVSDSFNHTSMKDALDLLMVRFQLLCDRNGIEIPEKAYPELASALFEELRTNVETFDSADKPEKMVPLTIYHGAGFADVYDEPEFESMHDYPGIINLAASKYVSDPRGFLRETIKTVDELYEDPEFEEFRETKSVLRYAAINYTRNPRDFLRKLMTGEASMPKGVRKMEENSAGAEPTGGTEP